MKGHIDWEVDESIQNPLQGSDHASLPTEFVKEESNITNHMKELSTEESTNKIEFKEILCPHNNIATAAMLGGIFEGEQVNQDVQGNESGIIIAFRLNYSLY